MERKKGIPLVALIIFIVLLVSIILTCVVILGTNKKKEPKQVATPTATPEPEPSPAVEQIEEEYTDEDDINSDSDVQEAYRLTGNNKTFAKYAVYSSGGFNSEENNIKNELKLQLAMSQVTNSDMDTQSDKKSVSKEVIESYVEKVFGDTSDIEYKDFSLFDSDTNFTDEYKTIGYKYNKNNASYEFNESDVEEEKPSEIAELITKVTKYNTKIEIYVKPIFVQSIYDEERQDYVRALYKNYDFQLKQYPVEDSIMAITNSDYETVLKSNYNQDADKLNYKEVNQNIDLNQLTEYKYTIVNTDEGYSLKSFEKIVNERPTQDDNDDNEMSEQEKAMFNSTFDSYTGSGKSKQEINLLIDAIKLSNESNKEKKDKIVSITFNGNEISLEDDDVDKLNEEISKIADELSDEKDYTVKAVYKSGLIQSITITEVENNSGESSDDEE